MVADRQALFASGMTAHRLAALIHRDHHLPPELAGELIDHHGEAVCDQAHALLYTASDCIECSGFSGLLGAAVSRRRLDRGEGFGF
jgi:hypothetical protein